MDNARKQAQLLQSNQDRLAAYLKAHPELLDELFRFCEPEVRERAMANTRQLDLHETGILCNRILYLSSTRIVHHANAAPRCRGKVIYTEREAHTKSNRIWNMGRGRMRVYHCPLCNGYHLTHTAHKDSDRQVA